MYSDILLEAAPARSNPSSAPRPSLTEQNTIAGRFPIFGTRQLCLIWLAGVLYAALCMAHWIGRPVPSGLVFNEMLSNLLQGRFDISPATIAGEAYIFKGHSYAYFGMFCALLRLPLLLTGNNGADVTGISLLIAAAISLACRLGIVATILNRAGRVNPVLRWAIIIAVAANGEAIQYLAPSIYQEVVSWGAALASIFVLLALRLVLGFAKPGAALYAAMALCAGLALLCKVTFGLGLYCAFGLLAAVQLWRSWPLGAQFVAALRKLAPAAAVLVLFAGLTGGVNYARWENPLTFMPLNLPKPGDKYFPPRPERLAKYGSNNVRRIPFALQYFFVPVWVLTDDSGKMISEPEQSELFDGVEFPPSSFFLSDPLTCILAVLGLGALTTRRPAWVDLAAARAVVAGLAVPTGVILTATYLAFRYRMEFYPAFDFLACIGLADLVWRERVLPKFVAPLFAGLAGFAMAAAFAGFLSYLLIGFGPATMFNMSRGWIGLLEDKVAGKNIYRPPFWFNK